MKASLLLFSGQLDSMWPAFESAEKLMKRLKKHHYAYPYQHISYEHGSHYMMPMPLKSDKFFKAERKYKKENLKNKDDIFQKTMQFIKEKW